MPHTNGETFIIRDRSLILQNHFYSLPPEMKIVLLKNAFLHSLSGFDDRAKGDQVTLGVLRMTQELAHRNPDQVMCESLLNYGLHEKHEIQGDDDNDEYFRNQMGARTFAFLSSHQPNVIMQSCTHNGRPISFQQMLINANPHLLSDAVFQQFMQLNRIGRANQSIVNVGYCKPDTVKYYFNEAETIFTNIHKLPISRLIMVQKDGCTILGLLTKKIRLITTMFRTSETRRFTKPF